MQKTGLDKTITEMPLDLPPLEPISVPAIIQTAPTSLKSHYDQQKTLDTVIACVVLEAGGEGTIGMEAINEVLTNRARRAFGDDSIISKHKIAIQPKQFSCFNAGVDTAIKRAKSHPRWMEAEKIVKSPPTNHTSGARFYYANRGRQAIQPPTWATKILKSGGKAVQIGNHVFLYGYRGG